MTCDEIMNLIIVESPTKAKTISRFLGRDFKVESSFGHIRDLPKNELGVDVENNFAPRYIIPLKARKIVSLLKKAAKNAETIILATDEDREGEAIAWHLAQLLVLNELKTKKEKQKTIERIVFHEITEKAVKEALKNPRAIDLRLVASQQARRILDRLVGYELSPFLWKKVARGLSAGRVQSVAVRLICEREKEIENFKPEEYWTIVALLLKIKNQKSKIKNDINEFQAVLTKINNEIIPKLGIKTKNEADKILKNLENAEWRIKNIEKKEAARNPLPPFTTSTLQQAASNRLGFSAKQTMRIAQQLYEGVELGSEGPVGLITYMRTDSLNLSQESIAEAKKFIEKNLSPTYALEKPRFFKIKTKGAQEAHEAIRPTEPQRTPESIKKFLDSRQFKLYDLIWRRFIASQMPPAIFNSMIVDIEAKPSLEKEKTEMIYAFRASGLTQKFDGFLKIWRQKTEESILPDLEQNEQLQLVELKSNQRFTEPPPRYSEATLIKTLEKLGIGRPSTYAPIISVIQERRYVEKNESKKFQPTDIGILVNRVLCEHFPQIVDYQFTAAMEEELDEIAEGEKEWTTVVRNFYEPFKKNLLQKTEEISKKNLTEEHSEELCEKCGKPMIVKFGRYGKFLACSGFPECKNTKPLQKPASIGIKCPKCFSGEIVAKKTKRGKFFYGCSHWPECDFALWDKPTGEKCPKCSSLLIEKRNQIKCSDKECDYYYIGISNNL